MTGQHGSAGEGRRNRVFLTLVKVVHTAIWATIEAAVLYVLATGVLGRTDRRTAIAGAVVTGEMVVFAANGFRCPLTAVAESLGAEDGSVTDIFLPRWFARNLPALHVPVVAAAIALHVRNLRNASTSA